MDLSLLRTASRQDTESNLQTAVTLELLGDACTRQQRYSSGSAYYVEAIEYVHNLVSEDGTPQHKLAVQSQWEADLRIKQCRALSESNSSDGVQEAIRTLEQSFPKNGPGETNRSTPCPFGNVEMHMLLGDLYLKTDRREDAMQEYGFALMCDPYTLEAVEKLARLGCDEDSLLSQLDIGINNALQREGTSSDPPKQNDRMIDSLPEIDALRINASAQSTMQNQLVSSHHHYSKLVNAYPHHPYFLLQLANLQQELGHILPSEQNYQRIRSLDPAWTEGMDRYAYLLFQLRMSRKNAFIMGQGGYLQYHYSCYGGREGGEGRRHRCRIEEELGKLCSDMLESDDGKPEAWNCLSLYHWAREDHEKALAFVDKAITLKPEYAYSHYLRGSILLASHRADHARLSFFRANSLQADVPSYEGLVESYIALGKVGEAKLSARAAVAKYPRDPRAFTLVGLVWSQIGDAGKEKALRNFRKAVTLDHGTKRPLFALVDFYASDGDFATCMKLLKDSIESGGKVHEDIPLSAVNTWNKTNIDLIRAKMGEIYLLSDEFEKALECFHTAISLNPQNGLAIQGLERVEKLLNGIDPDEEEEMGDGDDEMNDEDGHYY